MNQDHSFPPPNFSHCHASTQPPDDAAYSSLPWENFHEYTQHAEAEVWSPSAPPDPSPAATHTHYPTLDVSPPCIQYAPKILSPIPLQGMQQLIPYADTITPPTPPSPNVALPSPASSYYTPYTSRMSPSALAPVQSPTSPLSTSYLPIPSPLGSPYTQVSHSASFPTFAQSCSSPSLSAMLNYSLNMSSPSMESPMSFYSLNSPAMASTSSFHSLSQTTSPAIPQIPLSPLVESSARPSVAHQPQMDPSWPLPVAPESYMEASMQPSAAPHSYTGPSSRHSAPPYPNMSSKRATANPYLAKRPPAIPRQRRRVPQPIDITSKRQSSFAEHFKYHGAPGVPVRGVLNDDIVIDEHGERILERTGVRQIRVVVAWPGYQEVGTYIHVQEDGQFITRGRLAKLICRHLARALEKSAKQRPQYDLSEDAQKWTLSNGKGKRGISIDNLWLLRVAPAHGNIWLAELEVL